MWPKKLWKYFPYENHNSLVLNSSSSKKKWFFKCSFKNKFQISFCINMLLISSNIMPRVAPGVPRIDLHYLLVCRRQMWPGGKAINVYSQVYMVTHHVLVHVHVFISIWIWDDYKIKKSLLNLTNTKTANSEQLLNCTHNCKNIIISTLNRQNIYTLLW